MSGRYKETYHSPSGSTRLVPTKGKRRASCNNYGNPTLGPASLDVPARTTMVGRQLPNLAPKPANINSPSPSVEERGSISRHKRLRIDEHPQSSSQHLTLQQTHATMTEHTIADSGSNNNIPDLEGSNVLPMANTAKGSGSPSLAMLMDPLSGIHNTVQAETAFAFDFSLIPQVPPIAAVPQIPQASAVGFCPHCHAMWRNLRQSIMAFTFGQGLASGGVVKGELLQSYFGLQDHWNDGHVPGATGLSG